MNEGGRLAIEEVSQRGGGEQTQSCLKAHFAESCSLIVWMARSIVTLSEASWLRISMICSML